MKEKLQSITIPHFSECWEFPGVKLYGSVSLGWKKALSNILFINIQAEYKWRQRTILAKQHYSAPNSRREGPILWWVISSWFLINFWLSSSATPYRALNIFPPSAKIVKLFTCLNSFPFFELVGHMLREHGIQQGLRFLLLFLQMLGQDP